MHIKNESNSNFSPEVESSFFSDDKEQKAARVRFGRFSSYEYMRNCSCASFFPTINDFVLE